MKYYCMMVLTGEEKAFRDRAREIFREPYPSAVFYYFERSLYTKKRGWFEGALFPSYIFFGLDEFTTDFFMTLRAIKGFCRILPENDSPQQLKGASLDELSFLFPKASTGGYRGLSFFRVRELRLSRGRLLAMRVTL